MPRAGEKYGLRQRYVPGLFLPGWHYGCSIPGESIKPMRLAGSEIDIYRLPSLALAPPPPVVTREVTTGANKGRRLPNLARGKTLYDAVLRWKDDKPVADLAGYAIVLRPTTSPYWDHEIFVGKVNRIYVTRSQYRRRNYRGKGD